MHTDLFVWGLDCMLTMFCCLEEVLQVYSVFVRKYDDVSLKCQRQGFRFERNVQAQFNPRPSARDPNGIGIFCLSVVVVLVLFFHIRAIRFLFVSLCF